MYEDETRYTHCSSAARDVVCICICMYSGVGTGPSSQFSVADCTQTGQRWAMGCSKGKPEYIDLYTERIEFYKMGYDIWKEVNLSN
jgi:hypothetical protein